METPRYTPEEVVRRGEEIYDREIRARVEPQHRGKYLVIDIETGDYDMDTDELAVVRRVKAKHPGGTRCLLRVGYPYVHRLGGGLPVPRP